MSSVVSRQSLSESGTVIQLSIKMNKITLSKLFLKGPKIDQNFSINFFVLIKSNAHRSATTSLMVAKTLLLKLSENIKLVKLEIR